MTKTKMTTSTISIELPVTMPHSARLIARPEVAHRLLDGIGALRMWEHTTASWLFPRRRVDDVLAFAKRRIDVVDVES